MPQKKLSLEQRKKLLKILKKRFENNMLRHKGFVWVQIQAKLEASPEKLKSL